MLKLVKKASKKHKVLVEVYKPVKIEKILPKIDNNQEEELINQQIKENFVKFYTNYVNICSKNLYTIAPQSFNPEATALLLEYIEKFFDLRMKEIMSGDYAVLISKQDSIDFYMELKRKLTSKAKSNLRQFKREQRAKKQAKSIKENTVSM